MNLEVHKHIIEKSKLGDSKSQHELYKLYSKAMFNTCLRMLNHWEDAEDILQDSFSDAFSKLSTFVYKSTFGAWMKRITINNCINEIKRRKVDLVFCSDIPETIEKEQREYKLSVDQVKRAMMSLPNGSRIIFSLYLLEGYDHREIAEILNTSESNSKSQYMRAKRKIKELLIEEVYHEK